MVQTHFIIRMAVVAVSLLPTAVPALTAADLDEFIARGDQAWARRSLGHQGPRAAAGPIEEAITAYREALETDQESLAARWRLLRALYFKGEFVLDDKDARRELFEMGRQIADTGRSQIESNYEFREDSLDMTPQQVAETIGDDDPEAAEIFFWSATHWGLWGRYRGKIAAARQGVATKIRKFAEIVILLDPIIENAGGHRVLGRLNAEAPKIPFVTGWISRDRAVSELRQALEIAPQDRLTQLFLAEALLDYRPEQKKEALEILHTVADSEPDPEWLIEEIKTIEDAKALLARLGK